MTEQVYTPEQVATALQVKSTTVHKWLKENKLRGFKLPGGNWRISASALNEIIVAKVDPAPKPTAEMEAESPKVTLGWAIDHYLEITRNPDDRLTAGDIIDHFRSRYTPLMLSNHQIAIYLNRALRAQGVERVRDASGRYYLGVKAKN